MNKPIPKSYEARLIKIRVPQKFKYILSPLAFILCLVIVALLRLA
jgi:hypothetical protein